MKKIFWFLVGLALLAGLGKMFHNAWLTAAYFEENGQAATFKVGPRYNTSIWSSPLPIKKIHSYVAVMAPDHEVLIESDQALTENTEYPVRFVLRDKATAARKLSWRPIAGAVRLKAEADGAPVRLVDTDIFDRVVDRAMGPPAPGVYVRPRETAEAAPSRAIPTVPFMLAGPEDGPLVILWKNSTLGEWVLVLLWAVGIKVILRHAWTTPLLPSRKTGADRKDFVHPSMRRIDPDKPDAPSRKLNYTPKPEDHDYIQIGKPVATPPLTEKRESVPLPQTASSPTAPKPPAEPYSTATTAPFAPTADEAKDGPSLKLTRKPKPAPAPPSPPSPPTASPDAG